MNPYLAAWMYVTLMSAILVASKGRIAVLGRRYEAQGKELTGVQIFRDPLYVGLFGSNFFSFVLWIYVVQRLPLSIAYLHVGMSFVLVPIFARIALKEPLQARQIVGGILIASGIVVSKL